MKAIKWLILLGVLGILVFWWQSSRIAVPTEEKEKPVDRIVSTDWVLGTSQGMLSVVEYSDYQCPACKLYSNVGQRITELYGTQVGFTYRHFPLRQIHDQADLSAQAAEAAGKQGKFWEMTDLLFEKQDQWAEQAKARDFFISFAQELQLDVERFKQDMDSKEVKALVEADYLSGLVARVNATPTFFINGQRMNNLRGPDDLVARVELALQQATESAQPNE